MSKQYNSGYQAELEILRILRDTGFFAFRSAGSHTVVDIFATNGKEVKLIQSKKFSSRTKVKNYMNVKTLQTDIKRLEELQVPDNVSKEMWIKWKGEWVIKKIKK